MFGGKPRLLLRFLYVHLIHWVKLLSKHLEANFKHLHRMGLATDMIFLVLSSVNNDLHIYVFVAGVNCEITYVGVTELNNFPYISAKLTCTFSFSDKETWILRLKIWMLKFLGVSKKIKRRHTLKQ